MQKSTALFFAVVVSSCHLTLPAYAGKLDSGIALCIGVDHAAGFTPLRHAKSDAITMAQALHRRGYQVTLLTDAEATRAAVMEALKQKPAIIYFAGHGQDEVLRLHDSRIWLTEMSGWRASLFLDCCNIGSALQETGLSRVVAAGAHNAYESDEHGLFTKYLLRWMAADRAVHGDSLIKYLERRVKAETGGWQKPIVGRI